ncbi:aspartate kinase [Sporosarcina sp. ANT_H38]|uniref:amino acid kinase family protein n=1 Tax=Sporosarcina sp. ANT_H38 TaxID=2597358 RepID=UPI0011F27F90|nr:aspartate kinase [Sporosarcina sp. ANT_H38]KAA0966628.1 aspartate kinase [Sporosarcina sp. ANT_H38]
MIIQKFGGVAMKNEEMRLNCINHIKDGLNEFGDVVIVVSAIGRYGDPYSTDSLLQLTDAFTSSSAASDLAASCGELIAAAVLSAELARAGVINTVLHGNQAGIMTTGEFGDGTITHIDTSTILKTLETTRCIIIPGFQGIATNGQVMTLGRGGSDLSAIALAGALQASHVEFFKDVPGVMTHDPREVENTRKLDFLRMDDFIPLLDCERPVIQKRAALHAIKTATPLYIRGVASTEIGTWILP